jgi:glutamate racemase
VPAARDPRDRPIAVFDSGVGGLTVLHELLVHLPRESYLYLGDSARFPYGERTAQELEAFGMDIAEELLARRAKLLVVACNSLTAAALPALQRRMLETTLGVDVIGVVRPEAAQAVTATRNGRIGLLATRATVDSGAYARAISVVDAHVDLIAVACPQLAPLIQDPPGGELFTVELQDAVREACAPLIEAGVDTVVLGCTHYPLVRPMLQRMLGREVAIITSGAALARQVEHALGSRGLATTNTGEGEYSFLCTGDIENFRTMGSRFLQMPFTEVGHVDLPDRAASRGTPTTRPAPSGLPFSAPEVAAWPRS